MGPDTRAAFGNEPTVDDSALHRKVCPTCGARYGDEFRACPEDGTMLIEAAVDDHDDNLVGHTVKETYVFAKILGEGAMARVYEASHTRLRGKRFAIKVLHPEFCVYKEILQRFRREAEAAASIDSRHIIEVYDVDDTPDGRPFMVTELLKGMELGDHLFHAGILPFKRALAIARQLCDALSAAHRSGIIHRDMKPENVFLVGDLTKPYVKVIDFGISKDGKRPGTQLTRMGTVMGTPSFMAPEQAKGLPVTHAVDIYAVGGILYNMVTGKRPFDGDNPTEILQALLTSDPPAPHALNPMIPPDLEAVIYRAMARDPGLRYAHADELDQALAAVEQNLDRDLAGPPQPTLPGAGKPTPTLPERPAARGAASLGQARTALLGAALFAAILTASLLTTLLAAAMRLSGERGLGAGGLALALGAMLFIGATPAFLAFRAAQLGWGDAARLSLLARRVAGPAFAGATVYAIAWLLGRWGSVVEAARVDAITPGAELGAASAAIVGAIVCAGAQHLLRGATARA